MPEENVQQNNEDKAAIEPVVIQHTGHRHSKKKTGTILFFAGIICILFIGLLGFAGWQVKQVWALSTSPAALKTAELLRIPVAKVNGSKITYRDYIEDTQALKKFYGSQPEGEQKPSAQDLSDQVLSRLAANELIANLALSLNAAVSSEEITRARKDILAPFPDEATVNKQISDRYGWTLDHYVDRIVRPFLLEQSAARAFKESTDGAYAKYSVSEAQARHILIRVDEKKTEVKAKKEAGALLAKIISGKEEFSKVAKESSDDLGSKENGGLIDWFGKGKMVPEFEAAVFSLQPGEIAKDLVKSQYGFHIIKMEGKRTSRDFDSFMRDQIMNAKIDVVLPVHDPFQLIRDQLKQQSGPNNNSATTTAQE